MGLWQPSRLSCAAAISADKPRSGLGRSQPSPNDPFWASQVNYSNPQSHGFTNARQSLVDMGPPAGIICAGGNRAQ